MADYSAGTAIFISVIVGIILSVFLDGMFNVFVVAFMATYLTKLEDQNYIIGIIAALVLEMLIFLYGMVVVPDVRYTLPVNLDLFNFATGFIILCLISILLGSVGGYLATTVSKYKIRS